MKLHKLISRTVLATALVGATIGGLVASNNASASSQGFTDKADMRYKAKLSDNNKQQQSNVNTGVPDGFLTLDSVPNLQFGSNLSGNNYSSAQNDSSNGSNARLNLKDNNNGGGILRVTDYRNVDKSTNSNNGEHGWSLSASVGRFTNDKNQAQTNESWTINLNNGNGRDNYRPSDPFNTNEASYLQDSNFTSTTSLNDDSEYHDIINSRGNDNNNTHSGYGVNELNYNNNGDANIDVPNVPQGSYSSTITWQLSTNVQGYDNNWD